MKNKILLEKSFGSRIEELLDARQVKPRDFYDAIGILPQAFYDWKRRDQVPNAVTALKVAKYFGVTVEYLLTGETDNPLQARVDALQNRNTELANKLRSIADELATP